MPEIPPKPTVEQEMIRRLAAWKGIHTHDEAEHWFTRFEKPEWVPVFDQILQVMAPWEYAADEVPNVQHPEWDHLRTTPWDTQYKVARKEAGL